MKTKKSNFVTTAEGISPNQKRTSTSHLDVQADFHVSLCPSSLQITLPQLDRLKIFPNVGHHVCPESRSSCEVQMWRFSRRSSSDDTTDMKSVMQLICLVMFTLGNHRADILTTHSIVFNRHSLFMLSNSTNRR